MAPGMCLRITVQNRERILDAVDNVALETVREALLQHRHTTKHISHGTVRLPLRQPQRKAGRLDARFSSLSIPSVIIEEQESDMCGDADPSQWTGTICDTVSTPRRKLRKLEYIRNIVGCQNLPRLGCGESGGTLKDMVSQSDRSQCQDNSASVAVCVSTGETDSSGNGDCSQHAEEESTVTEDRGSLLETDQGEGNLRRSETSGLLGKREETLAQTESLAQSAHVIEMIPIVQDIGRMSGSVTDNASQESTNAMLTSGMVISDIGTNTDNCSSLIDETLPDSSSKVPTRESVKVTPQSAHSLKTTEKNTTVAPEIIVGDATNQNPDNRQQAVAMPNLQENVVSKPTIPTRKDGNTDVIFPSENMVPQSTVTMRKDGNNDASSPHENVVSKSIVPSKKVGKNSMSLPHEDVSKSTIPLKKDGNSDVSSPHENVVSKSTLSTRKDGNTYMSLPNENVSKSTIHIRKDRNTDVSLLRENVVSRPTVPMRKDGSTDVSLPLENVSKSTVHIRKDGNADVSLSHGNVVSKSTVPTRRDVSSPREKFGSKDAGKGVNVSATKSRDSLNGLEEIRSSILAELEELCQCHAPESLVTCQPSSVMTNKTVRQRKTVHREEKGQVKTVAKAQSTPVSNQTKVNTPEATNKKNTMKSSVKSPANVHTATKKVSEARVVTPPKGRAADKTKTSETLRPKVAQKHKSGTAQDNSGCVLQKRSRTTPVKKCILNANSPRTVNHATGSNTTKPNIDGDYAYFQFGGEECIHRNPFCDRTESKSELLLRLELLNGEIKRHESLVKSSRIAEDAPFQHQRLVLQLELELLQSWLLYQGVGQLLFPGHSLPAALQLGSNGKKTVTDNQRVMLLDRVPTVDEYGKLYDLRQTLETSRKLHTLGIKGHSNDDVKPKMRQRQSMLATLLSLPSKVKLQQLQRQLADFDHLREHIWAEEHSHNGTTLMLEYLDVRCCGLEIHIKAIEGILDDDHTVTGDEMPMSEGDQQLMSMSGGDQQHSSTSEGHQQHMSMSDGDQQHLLTSEDDQQHSSMSEGHQQHSSTSEGDQQHMSSSEVDQQHNSMSEGDQQHNSVAEGDQQHKSTSEGDRQHKSTSDDVETDARKSAETIASLRPTANSDIATSAAEVGNSSAAVSPHNGNMSSPICNGTSTLNDTHNASESGVRSATSNSLDDSDYVECDMDMSKSSDQSDHIVCDAAVSPEVNSHATCSVETVPLAASVAPATQSYDLDITNNATAISVITSTAQMCSEVPTWPGMEGVYADNWYYEAFPSTNMLPGGAMTNYQVNAPASLWQSQSQPSMPPGQLYCWLVQQMSANPFLWQNAPTSLQNYLLQPASFSEPAANAQWAQWLLANWQFHMGFAIPRQ